MRTRYANLAEDPEAVIDSPTAVSPVPFLEPAPLPERTIHSVACPGWPFDRSEAQGRQAEAGPPTRRIQLPDGSPLDMLLVPAGEFVMGSTTGPADEYPPHRATIERPFYMAKTEITNAQYALFDPAHDSAYISMPNKDHGDRGYPVNQPAQPVVRVTWLQATSFCRWLSEQTGHRFDLPTEAQWEWACRAGSDSPYWYGDRDCDFGQFANLADAALNHFARGDSPKWQPKDARFDDRAMVTNQVGRYQANAWGLCDMHGNAAEWTKTVYRPYPYDARDGRDDANATGARVVRGGSWYDRPERASSSFRLRFEPWQPVYSTGFRVVMNLDAPPGLTQWKE
jgi:formylglycine-generating enzyme required for sulfatase activity